MVNDPSADKLAIRETIENWVVWRDAGDWERFATVWHSDGWMTATWFQGPAEKFIEASREGFNKGVSIPDKDDDQPAWACGGCSGRRRVHRAFL